jgi:hypothetical protein
LLFVALRWFDFEQEQQTNMEERDKPAFQTPSYSTWSFILA